MSGSGKGKTLGLVATGSMLEFYEFYTTSIFLHIIGTVFFAASQPEWIRELQAIALLSISLVFRPVSAIIIGQIGDRQGRKRSFFLTMLLMAVPTTLIGVLPPYAVIGIWAPILLLGLRIIQAMASAGEMAGAAVFTNELAEPSRRGLASGMLYGAIHIGYFLAAAAAALVTLNLTHDQVLDFGWRIPFLIGGILGFVALLARRKLHESPAFILAQQAPRQRAPFKIVLSQYRPEMLAVLLLAGYVGATITIIYTYMPLFLQSQRDVPTSATAILVMIAFVILSVAAVFWGWLADRIGPTKVVRIGAVTTIVVVLLAAFFDGESRSFYALLGWYALASFAIANVGCAFYIGSMLFPAAIRLTGFGVSYNLGLALFVGTVPMSLSLMIRQIGGIAIVVYLVTLCLVGIVSTILADRALARRSADPSYAQEESA